MKPSNTKYIPAFVRFLTIAGLATSASHAAMVFADDFSEPSGTAIIDKAPDIGSPWTGSAPTISSSNTFDTTGAPRAAFGAFTSALGAGQMLTLQYDTLNVSGGNFFSGGYAGVSLYVGGNERVFTGDTGGAEVWGVDGGAIGFQASSDTTSTTTATFMYWFDTGEWTFTTTSGVSLAGSGNPGEAFDNLRIANGNGGDINVDNLTVDISAVPEPSSIAMLGLFGVALGMKRRR
ncbi:PEP-CTERM sorting domain-containing protein [Luteolibacter pohnpeiensis]|uniref:PEP-CTERM sorting domain-containing protein n=1 Tax=Luteolibacter pohnpeiensis TaxID=454153 RepID=A0A934S9C9_9BACT|nr:PEP-CTERM sorting domain-containing protein [Luteolibacter pohnpeiensis]MBK1884537.1 PEP-CTERM sorting domain-containing protein [Luteolibacter pohnpeiensis]